MSQNGTHLHNWFSSVLFSDVIFRLIELCNNNDDSDKHEHFIREGKAVRLNCGSVTSSS